MKVMVSAGEVSGDVHGSYLVGELKKLAPGAVFFGVGSERLAAAGVDIRLDITKRGTIGIFEALPNLFPLLFAFRRIKKLVLLERPDLVILIDSQGINVPLAKFCKKLGVRTVYYIPPQEWLWGTPRNLNKVARTVDLIVAIFQKEYEAYRRAGANVVYFGHPLIDIVKPASGRDDFTKKILGSAADDAPIISLCPGSRQHELKALLPILLRSARLIQKSLPCARFVMPVASRRLATQIAGQMSPSEVPVIVGATYDALAASDLALCASGTINFEASLLGCPNIMVYKLSRLTYLIGKHLMKIDRKLKYYSMPNLILDEKIIPELVMDDATPEKVAAAAISVLEDPARPAAMKKAFERLRRQLGQPGVIRRAAQAIML